MRIITSICCVLAILFLCQEIQNLRAHILKGMHYRYNQMLKKITTNCKKNGLSEKKVQNLQDSINNMTECLSSKSIFVTPLMDYLKNLEECSSAPRLLAKKCLSEDQKWFPDFILELASSLSTFMYDHQGTLQDEIPVCLTYFQDYEVQLAYVQCLSPQQDIKCDSTGKDSKREFCNVLRESADCLKKSMESRCQMTPKLIKFVEEFKRAKLKPCKVEEPEF